MAEPILRDGSWWHETKDGWVLWDAAAKRWNAAEGPPPPPAAVGARSPLAAAAAFALSHWTTLLTGAGLLVYAVVRVAHDEFYSQMAVTAEEVGLDQTLILGRAALYVFLYAIGFAILVALAPLWWDVDDAHDPKKRKGDDDPERRKKSRRSSYAVRVFGTLFLLSVLVADGQVSLPVGLTTSDADLVRRPHWLFAQGCAILMVLNAGVSGIAALRGWGRLARTDPADTSVAVGKLRKRQVWLVLLAVTLTFLCSFVLSGRYGFIRGDQVLRGEPVVPGPLSLLSVRADPICVDWPGEDAPEALAATGDAPLMYLGQADGFLILYDRRQGAPLRIPSGEAVLKSAYPDPTTCTQPSLEGTSP
jgi:hypothetical protein